jgi:long-subunit fatty acid transport protein
MTFNKFILYIIFIIQILAANCHSENSIFPVVLRPITSGPVSLALGGSSIVHIDDPLSAIQNPAKLPLTKSPQYTLGFYNAFFKEISHLKNNGFSGTEGSNVSEFKMNYLGLSCPFRLFSMDMAAAISYAPLYSFERSFSFQQHDKNALTDQRQWFFNQDGYMSAISIAYGVLFHPNWSFGISWNLFHEDLCDNELRQEISMKGYRNDLIYFEEDYHQNISHRYSGNNLNLGLMWRLTSDLNVGAVFHTRFNNTVSSQITEKHTFGGTQPNLNFLYSDSDHLEIPMSWGIGISYDIVDNWKLFVDFRQILWETTHYTNSLESIQYLSGYSEDYKNLNVQMIHLGSVYRSTHNIGCFTPVFRMGTSSCLDRGMIHPEPDTTIGFGLGLVGKNLAFNIGYQYQIYKEIEQELMQESTLQDKIRSNVVGMSLTYRIKN